MAIKDISKKPFIADRETNTFIGIDYPFHRSEGVNGYFASTSTTIDAVKNNIKMLLNTHKGERLMQPDLGTGLRRFIFEQFTDEIRIAVENEIVNTFDYWLPFVEITELEIDMIGDDAVGRNKMMIDITFNITKDPNTHASVQVEVGE